MILLENYYTRDLLRKIRHFQHNRKIDKIVNECKDIDSILDFDAFKDYIVENIKKKNLEGFLAREEFGGEGLLYGHREAFFEYAQVESDAQRFLFPCFEHGVDIKERLLHNVCESAHHSFVSQGPYKNKMIHNKRPHSPIYNVGPYVLYAKKYYNNEKFSMIKEKNKKTLLLFPAHTFEGAKVDFDKEKFVKSVFEKFKREYDTILVSVYWNDVDDPIYDLFKKEGAKLVSAGFRGDPNFIVRLRAMIELSDAVASNLVGAYIGYSIALGKPMYLFSDRASLSESAHEEADVDKQRYIKVLDEFFGAFSSLTPTDEQFKKQKEIYEKYWGGETCFKTPEEAKTIISLSSKLLKESRGTTKGYEKAIVDSLKGSNKSRLNKNEIEALRKAIEI